MCLEVNDEQPAICNCRGSMAPMHRACIAELVRVMPNRELRCGVCRSMIRVQTVRRWCWSTDPLWVTFLASSLTLAVLIDVNDMRGVWRPQDSVLLQSSMVVLCLAWREMPGNDGRYIAMPLLVHALAMLTQLMFNDECLWLAGAVVVATIPMLFASRRVAPAAHGVALLATLMLGWGVARRSAMMVTCYGSIVRLMTWIIVYASVFPKVVRITVMDV